MIHCYTNKQKLPASVAAVLHSIFRTYYGAIQFTKLQQLAYGRLEVIKGAVKGDWMEVADLFHCSKRLPVQIFSVSVISSGRD